MKKSAQNTGKKKGLAVVWLRKDLRLEENEAIYAASFYSSILFVFCLDHQGSGSKERPGGASQWWLHHSLEHLSNKLQQKENQIFFFRGNAQDCLKSICEVEKPDAVFWNRTYMPNEAPQTKKLIDYLENQSIDWDAFQGGLLCNPNQLLKTDDTPYKVFTPFWRNFVKKYHHENCDEPRTLPSLDKELCKKIESKFSPLSDLDLLPRIPWDNEFYKHWKPGEEHAHKALDIFLNDGILSYNESRDFPGVNGTSGLSPHLHFGEIHPRFILGKIISRFGALENINDLNVIQFAKEILWREFSYHLLQHFPQIVTEPLRVEFKKFPWKTNKNFLNAWQKGKTGYPFVDAGMRQLWTTGWMHNRVRMVVASFLIKHLNLHWQHGASWFWDTLLDADLASNTQGWQWTAGCGADAQPFFRIFNPFTQGEKFDKNGDYIRTWCPELRELPSKYIHRPWEAPIEQLQQANVSLGENYPHPIVDHKEAREQALSAYKNLPKT